MIRFVYIGSQITDIANEEAREFAFFNTVTDMFIDINGCQVFDSIQEFEEYGEGYYYYERCKNLIPDWYTNNDKPPNSSIPIQSKER